MADGAYKSGGRVVGFAFWFLSLGRAYGRVLGKVTLVGFIKPIYSLKRTQAQSWPDLAQALT